MKLLTRVSRFQAVFPIGVCASLFFVGALAHEREQQTEPGRPYGTGFLIIDPRNSEGQVKERMRMLLSQGDGLFALGSLDAEIGSELDELFSGVGETSDDFPEVSFTFRPNTTAGLFRESLLDSDLARQSKEVCPADCPFRTLDRGAIHFHLTRPGGGLGDSVLLLSILGPTDSLEEARKTFLADALPRVRKWKSRHSRSDDELKPGVRIFGLRVFLGVSADPDVGPYADVL